MRSIAVILSIAISSLALSSAPVSATKMNGKCCQSSDGGRSALYKWHMSRRAIPHTCSAYAASCIRDSRDRADKIQMCMTAKAQCLQTGVHVGPYSGRHYAGMTKI